MPRQVLLVATGTPARSEYVNASISTLATAHTDPNIPANRSARARVPSMRSLPSGFAGGRTVAAITSMPMVMAALESRRPRTTGSPKRVATPGSGRPGKLCGMAPATTNAATLTKAGSRRRTGPMRGVPGACSADVAERALG